MEAGEPGREQAEPASKAAKSSPKQANRRKMLRWGIIALAVIVGVIAWLTTRDNGGSSEPSPAAETIAPRIVTVDELREVAAKLGQPIYWAGPVKSKELELQELGEGGVQVLYLPQGTEAGEESVKSLTVGSYPLPDPEKALEGFAKRKGSTVRHASDGREVVSSAESPTSVYFASPDNSVQVEVYDPSPKRALSLALSGQVNPTN
jgi:hypothetical protein